MKFRVVYGDKYLYGLLNEMGLIMAGPVRGPNAAPPKTSCLRRFSQGFLGPRRADPVRSKQNPVKAANIFAHGLELEKKGHLFHAVDNYFTVLKLEPGHLEALTRSCEIIFKRSTQPFRLRELVLFLEAGVKKHTDDLFLQNNLGFGYYLQRKYNDAEAVYRTIINSKGAGDPHFRSMVTGNLARSLAAQGFTGKAKELAESAVELDPDNMNASRLRARILGEHGRASEALDAIVEIERTEANNLWTRSVKAGILAKSGQPEEAIRIFMECLKEDPKNPRHAKDLADAYAIKGRLRITARYYLKAISLAGSRKETYEYMLDLIATVSARIKSARKRKD